MDDYLGRPFSDDLWSDYAIEQATALALDLTPAGAPPPEAVPALLEMVTSPDDGLVVAAADALREFDPAAVAPNVTPETVQRLRDVAGRRPGLSAIVIERLLNSLSFGGTLPSADVA